MINGRTLAPMAGTSYVRPTKVGGYQQYVDEVSSGITTVYAKELDDDFNVLYNAVNQPLPAGSVSDTQIVDRSISGVKLRLKAVTYLEIADKTITNAQIANGTITQALLDPAMSMPIQPGYITNAMLGPGCVSDSKVADVGWAKITGAPTSFPPTGAATGDLAGSTYPGPIVAAGKITRAKLATDVTP